ncbi:MAG: hypothetical protein MI700_14050 [Balneolales bacterium]|nr:hypothetical protein [Balneolales bacterium]
MKKNAAYLITVLAFLLSNCTNNTVSVEEGNEIDKNIPPGNGQNLEIREDVVSPQTDFSIQTGDVFAVWWDPVFNEIAEDVPEVIDFLADVRKDAMDSLGFGELYSTRDGYFANVYIHVPEEDRFPDYFGNGVGFSEGGIPYLAMPYGSHNDRTNVFHEGFHIMQSSTEYLVVDDNIDAIWIIEASAEWYQASRNADNPRAFIVAGAVYANPHFALWHLPESGRPDDPSENGWLYGVRQYGMSVFLYYLTNIKSVPRSVISGVYTTNATVTAQEYIYNAVGGDTLRSMFADWAVETAVGFDYLTEEQTFIAMDELNFFAAPEEIKAHSLVIQDTDANGTFCPPVKLAPRSWAYSSFLINNTGAADYTFKLTGDKNGSEGASSHFEARIAIRNSAGELRYIDLPMTSAITGEASVSVNANDDEIYVVVSSVPENFGGNQHFGYAVDITRN